MAKSFQGDNQIVTLVNSELSAVDMGGRGWGVMPIGEGRIGCERSFTPVDLSYFLRFLSVASSDVGMLC